MSFPWSMLPFGPAGAWRQGGRALRCDVSADDGLRLSRRQRGCNPLYRRCRGSATLDKEPSMRSASRFAGLILMALPTAALAHHPGSHATRVGGNRAKVDAVALASDDCTRIDTIRPGAPGIVAAPAGLTPVTARLQRGQGTCAATAAAVRSEQVIELPLGVRQILLYVE